MYEISNKSNNKMDIMEVIEENNWQLNIEKNKKKQTSIGTSKHAFTKIQWLEVIERRINTLEQSKSSLVIR